MNSTLDNLEKSIMQVRLESSIDLLNILSNSIQSAKKNALEMALPPNDLVSKGLILGLDFALGLIEDAKSAIIEKVRADKDYKYEE